MKNLFFALAALSFSTGASASYLESCEFKATVIETVQAPDLDGSVQVYTPLVKIKIESAIDQGSHMPQACAAKVGTEEWLVSKAAAQVISGQELKIDYFYVNSRGPNGIYQSERWTIIN